jgi:hypothetical protein
LHGFEILKEIPNRAVKGGIDFQQVGLKIFLYISNFRKEIGNAGIEQCIKQ